MFILLYFFMKITHICVLCTCRRQFPNEFMPRFNCGVEIPIVNNQRNRNCDMQINGMALLVPVVFIRICSEQWLVMHNDHVSDCFK